MSIYRILRGDVLSFARHYKGPRFHALFCDPPYEMKFMGKKWDNSGISFRKETWEAFSKLLTPGAFLIAFASARGWHRQAVAMEDASLVMHPSVFCLGFSYGSGFPKATRIDSQIDRHAGVEREGVEVEYRSAFNSSGTNQAFEGETHSRPVKFTKPSTPLAQAWEGHRYGLQALKPALEPILVFQKPYEGKP